MNAADRLTQAKGVGSVDDSHFLPSIGRNLRPAVTSAYDHLRSETELIALGRVWLQRSIWLFYSTEHLEVTAGRRRLKRVEC